MEKGRFRLQKQNQIKCSNGNETKYVKPNEFASKCKVNVGFENHLSNRTWAFVLPFPLVQFRNIEWHN